VRPCFVAAMKKSARAVDTHARECRNKLQTFINDAVSASKVKARLFCRTRIADVACVLCLAATVTSK
jgi:hypothetical protein